MAPALTRLPLIDTANAQSASEPGWRHALSLFGDVKYPADFKRFDYVNPVTPDDVIFSLETLKKLSPFYAAYYRHVVKAEKSGERDIKFTFDGPGNRELPTIVGEVPVLPKHWWEGTDEQGRKRDISATTLQKPLGSAPYRIKEFVAGRSVILERVMDYWGANLPVRIGQNNFDG